MTTGWRGTVCLRTDLPPTWKNFTSSLAMASYGPPSGEGLTHRQTHSESKGGGGGGSGEVGMMSAIIFNWLSEYQSVFSMYFTLSVIPLIVPLDRWVFFTTG